MEKHIQWINTGKLMIFIFSLNIVFSFGLPEDKETISYLKSMLINLELCPILSSSIIYLVNV